MNLSIGEIAGSLLNSLDSDAREVLLLLQDDPGAAAEQIREMPTINLVGAVLPAGNTRGRIVGNGRHKQLFPGRHFLRKQIWLSIPHGTRIVAVHADMFIPKSPRA